VSRLKEPSTWAGLAGIMQGLGAMFPAYAAVFHGLTMVAGGVAVMVREGGPGDASQP
jgi:hypothetical protein